MMLEGCFYILFCIYKTCKRPDVAVNALVRGILLVLMTACETFAAAVPQEDTPEYKIGFYAFDCYHM